MRVEPDEGKGDIERLEGKIDRIAGEVAAIRRHFLWERIFGILKTLAIVIPLVWGSIVIYPVVMKMYDQTQALIKQTEPLLKYAK